MRRARGAALLGALLACGVATAAGANAASTAAGQTPEPPPGTITVDASAPVAAFRTDRALGAGVDGHGQGETAQIYTRANIRRMLGAGLRPLSYRLRTELGVEAWHWNPRGAWSDPRHQRGYWTSSPALGPPILVSHGYRLPRRGNTVDQANDNGYSRLDDGDPRTFWKSNPYLGSAGPQWILVDLGRRRAVDAVGIDWASPWARRVRVQWWTGTNAIVSIAPERRPGHWVAFGSGTFAGHAGAQARRIAGRPVLARFVRIVLTRGSGTAPPGSIDWRDRAGYAVREIHVGRWRHGRVADMVRHAPSNRRQTVIYTSSTDPWHRASDLDRGTEQPGLDRVLRSALAGGRPALVPAPVLYGTPADAVAELRYLRARRYPLAGVELGEEPDGQLMGPADYAALYARFAGALRSADRRIALGGPGYQTSIPDWVAWPDRHGSRSWTGQFVAGLRARHRLRDLSFFSFEWYPFDNVCGRADQQLADAPGWLASIVRRQRQDGLPRRVPMIISEYGYSAFAGEPEVSMPGALLGAEIPAQFLTLGGRTAYLYGYEPDVLIQEGSHCNTWGNLILLQSDDSHHVIRPVATYYAAQLVSRRWAQAGHGRHVVFRASSDQLDALGRPLVRAYAVRRPDGRLAVLIINADQSQTRTVRLRIVGPGGRELRLAPPADLFQLSGAQYRWHAHGPRGFAWPDRPPAHVALTAGAGDALQLPPYSISVVRARLS